MVLGVFVCCEFDYVGFKVIQGQGQGQNSRSFWPINNPYFDVLKLAKSRNNRYEYLYILKDMILKFKKKKLTGNPSGGLIFDQKFLKLVLKE